MLWTNIWRISTQRFGRKLRGKISYFSSSKWKWILNKFFIRSQRSCFLDEFLRFWLLNFILEKLSYFQRIFFITNLTPLFISILLMNLFILNFHYFNPLYPINFNFGYYCYSHHAPTNYHYIQPRHPIHHRRYHLHFPLLKKFPLTTVISSQWIYPLIRQTTFPTNPENSIAPNRIPIKSLLLISQQDKFIG